MPKLIRWPRLNPESETFSSLGIRNYRLLWFGIIFHAGALWMEMIARPVLVYELTGSPLQLSLVILARMVPQFGFGMFGGLVADWFDRKQVLLLSQLAALALNVVFAALLLSGLLELWHIYAAAAVRGATMAFDQPARQSLIPSIVPVHRVMNAIALLSATQNTMRILGTAAAGFGIALLGVDGAFVAIAIIYSGAAASTLLLRVESHERPERGGVDAVFGALGEAWRFAFAHAAIRGAILIALVHFAFGLSFMQLFAPLFALDVLDIGEVGFGLMMSVAGLGSLGGALFIASRSPTRLGIVLPFMVVAFGSLLMLFSLSTYVPQHFGRVWLFLPFTLVFAVGIFQTGIFALVQSLLLDQAPAHMRGRIMGLLAFDRATMALGVVVGGVLAEAIGTQPSQIIYGALLATSGLALFAFAPSFRASVLSYGERATDARREPAASDLGTEDPQQGQAALVGAGDEGRDPHPLR